MNVIMNLQEAAGAMAGTPMGENVSFTGVSTDTRKVTAGELFIALRGENFDGHEFVASAKERGAVAAVVDSRADQGLKELGLPLIAVTGSNGKTTSKEMIASILKVAFGDAVLATQGNFNNDIGLPLTLLTLNSGHRAAIIEMGMNHPGEIAYLTRIAKPTVALVTNAQRAHLAGMGSIETIATEKGSVFTGLAKPGAAVFNADDPWADLWRAQAANHRVVSFSFEQAAEVTGRYLARGLENRLTISAQGQEVEVALALPGAHNARNALGAATAALAAGVTLADVREGLNNFRGIKGRLQRRPGLNGAILLDDTYNANPDSVRAGIDVLAATVGKQILVLGDMGEIGAMTGQFHDEVGGYAKSQGVDRLLALGESSALAVHNFGAGGQHFKRIEDLIAVLANELTPQTTVLIKGSRFMRMERVVDAVAEAASAAQPEGNK